MKESCLDIGEIQSFLDGELRHEDTVRVSGHLASCDDCTLMLSRAEDESALVFSALEREFDTLVPTQRLWTRINDSIAIDKNSQPFWKKAWALVAAGLLTPSMAAAASLLIVFGVVGALVINRQQSVATVPTPIVSIAKQPVATTAPPVKESEIDVASSSPDPRSAQPRGTEFTPTTVAYRSPSVKTRPASVSQNIESENISGYLPAEESYAKTIAGLSKTVATQKDALMRPSERVLYERDMAVVDDAISKMRDEVRKNPRNESAKQILYSSYQNKIDLLNSVSQKEDLVASLR